MEAALEHCHSLRDKLSSPFHLPEGGLTLLKIHSHCTSAVFSHVKRVGERAQQWQGDLVGAIKLSFCAGNDSIVCGVGI